MLFKLLTLLFLQLECQASSPGFGNLDCLSLGNNLVVSEMVKPGAVLVDVGLTRVCHLGRNLVVGDVHRDARQVRDALSNLPIFRATHRWLLW